MNVHLGKGGQAGQACAQLKAWLMGFPPPPRQTEPCGEGQKAGQAVTVQGQEGGWGEMKKSEKGSRIAGREGGGGGGGPSTGILGRQTEGQSEGGETQGRGRERGWGGPEESGEMAAAAMGGRPPPQMEQSKPEGIKCKGGAREAAPGRAKAGGFLRHGNRGWRGSDSAKQKKQAKGWGGE